MNENVFGFRWHIWSNLFCVYMYVHTYPIGEVDKERKKHSEHKYLYKIEDTNIIMLKHWYYYYNDISLYIVFWWEVLQSLNSSSKINILVENIHTLTYKEKLRKLLKYRDTQ